jgi:hypothetical protein
VFAAEKNGNDEAALKLFNQYWRTVCKASSVEIKCEVANGDFLGFDLKLVCFSHGVPLYGAEASWLP